MTGVIAPEDDDEIGGGEGSAISPRHFLPGRMLSMSWKTRDLLRRSSCTTGATSDESAWLYDTKTLVLSLAAIGRKCHSDRGVAALAAATGQQSYRQVERTAIRSA
ncbi:MAG: hypothetical protein MZW92_05600 [Comamonadaceae bacterium]|nr:hypothetical protein [Comamonadaceae bacterium]